MIAFAAYSLGNGKLAVAAEGRGYREFDTIAEAKQYIAEITAASACPPPAPNTPAWPASLSATHPR